MKNKFFINLFIICATCLLVVLACSKSNPLDEIPPAPFPQINTFDCPNAPDYGDSIICPKNGNSPKDYKISPINNPGSGKYYAWPAGIVIDQNTGEINVTQSETGLRYIIGFIKDGSKDTCLKEIVLGGVTYVDSIYVLENNDTLALPHFNANPVPTSVCDDSGDDDYPGMSGGMGHGNDKCEFDDDDDADGGGGPEPPPGQRANDQKVRVRTISGIINLKKSIDDGVFGDNPQNGDEKTVTIWYRLNDCSKKRLRKLNVKLIYYDKVSDIPQSVKDDIHNKREQFMQTRVITPNGKPRPPQIIITRAFD